MFSRKPKPTSKDTFPCPHCGAQLPVGSRCCPECGSDEETGWAEDAHLRSADIPTGYSRDDDFDYDEFARRELGAPRRPRALLKFALVIAAIILLVILLVLAYAF